MLHLMHLDFIDVAVAVSAFKCVCLWLAGAQLARCDLLGGSAMHFVPGYASFHL